MPGHEEFDAGLREKAATNLGNITGNPPPTAGTEEDGGLTARDILNILLQAGGQAPQAPPAPPTPQGPAPLIDPQILAQIQAIVSSIDPNLNLDPASLASLLSTVTDEVGNTQTGVLDQP